MCGDAWAVVAGTVIGSFGTLATTYLQHHLANKKQTKIDVARKSLLKKALDGVGGDGWMGIQTLAQIVGADLDSTRALLIEIDARGSMKLNKEMWSLLSRNPLPTTD